VFALILAGAAACTIAPAPVVEPSPSPSPVGVEVSPLPGVEATPPAPVESAPPTPPTDFSPVPAIDVSPVPVPTLGVGPDATALPNPNSVPVPAPGSCHIVNGLPDHVCTPGLLNPRLTPAQLCAPGFSTKAIRPPSNYTDSLKKRLMASYGQVGLNPLTGRPWSTTDVELDHAVSLEDLGHPWSPLNLWPEPRRSTGAEPNAEEKDQAETAVHEMICADQAHAADYAARLAADWTQFRRPAATSHASPKDPEP
jgi:hypothetical protein